MGCFLYIYSGMLLEYQYYDVKLKTSYSEVNTQGRSGLIESKRANVDRIKQVHLVLVYSRKHGQNLFLVYTLNVTINKTLGENVN